MRISDNTLDNGLKVLCGSQPGLQTVTFAFGVHYGSVDENPKVNGSAHFLEHMLFKGTKKRNWKQISDQLKELGVRYNAFTDHETTVYYMQTYRGYANKTMEIMSDMILNSTLPEKEFELERGPIINENLIHHDNSKYMISDYIPKALYKKNPAKMSVGGDNEKTISKIRREDLENIYTNYYTPKNSVLSIYGGMGEKEMAGLASRYFGGMDGAYKKPERKVAREKQERRLVTMARKGIKQTRIGIGFQCSEFSERSINEYITLLVAERYLDDRLFDEVRQKRGLSYDPMASYEPYDTFGFIAAATGIEPKKVEEAKKVMLKEFEKLHDGEIDRKEFEDTKKTLSIENRVKTDNTAQMAIEMTVYELMYGGKKVLQSIPDAVAKVKLDDMMKYAEKYIKPDKYGMVLLKPS